MFGTLVPKFLPIEVCSTDEGKTAADEGSNEVVLGIVGVLLEFSLLV